MSTFRMACVASLLTTLFTLSACDTSEGPLEETGEEMDQAIDEAGDKVEETREEMSN